MTNIAYELGNQVQENLQSSNSIDAISYDSLSLWAWEVQESLEMS